MIGKQPTVTITRTGGDPLPLEVAARLQAALAREADRISDRLDVLKIYPVAQLGVACRL